MTGWINIGVSLQNGLKGFSRKSHAISLGNRATRGKLENGPVGYETTFDLPANAEEPIRDTFLDMTGWGKVSNFILHIHLFSLKTGLNNFCLFSG